MTKRILIVGAGPTGLALAIQLWSYGQPCDVAERRTDIDSRSKALSVNSATQELFDDLGIGAAFRARATPNECVHVHWNHRILHRVDLRTVPSRYPGFAMLPQFETEAILRARLAELGGEVASGTELVALQQRGEQVLCTLRGPDGSSRIATYRYVVGCDGPLSSVRRLAGIEFSGFDYDMHFAMCDAPVRWPGYSGGWHYYVLDGGFMILIPLTRDLHRVVLQFPGALDPDKKFEHEDFVRWAERMGLEGFELGPPVWTTSARFYNRLAARFRVGNVFLAGDAAHLFSPIGGQGMNTGLQDATNLSWKLAMVERDEAHASLLDTYEVERRAFAEETRDATDAMTRAIALLDRHPRGPLGAFLPSASGGPFLTQALPRRLSGVGLSYAPRERLSPASQAAFLSGKRVADAGGAAVRPEHDSHGGRLVLNWSPTGPPLRGIERALERLARDNGLRLNRIERRAGELSCVEAGGQPVHIYGAWFALVRPDRIVEIAGPCETRADVDALARRVQMLALGSSSAQRSVG